MKQWLASWIESSRKTSRENEERSGGGARDRWELDLVSRPLSTKTAPARRGGGSLLRKGTLPPRPWITWMARGEAVRAVKALLRLGEATTRWPCEDEAHGSACWSRNQSTRRPWPKSMPRHVLSCS